MPDREMNTFQQIFLAMLYNAKIYSILLILHLPIAAQKYILANICSKIERTIFTSL